MGFNVNTLMYGYLYICVFLLLYNIIYIFRSKLIKKIHQDKKRDWEKQILYQFIHLNNDDQISDEHRLKLLKKLVKINELLPYHDALESLKEQPNFSKYIENLGTIYQQLAYSYSKKDNMKRAFFAYFIANYPVKSSDNEMLITILLGYLDDSTIYCRENVLKAMCTLGNEQAVENTLSLFNQNQWFHHQKLVADNLAKFTGNQESLMKQLWKHKNDWNENIMVAIVQFISLANGSFQETFFAYLNDDRGQIEIKLAILRYFRTHYYQPVVPLLYAYLNENDYNENLTIVAAFVLDHYPSKQTIAVLKQALYHPNWYVRYNSASSLINLKVSLSDLNDVLNGEDRYAKEILTYMYEKEVLHERNRNISKLC